MYPRLLTTPFFTLHTFGLLLAAAYLTAYWWLMRAGERERLDADALGSLGIWAIVGAIVGAKALMIVRSLPESAASPSDFFSLSLLSAAGDFYGGFLGALAACFLFFRTHPKLSPWRTADAAAPAIAIGQAIGRIGCFMAGDDYGRPTSLPWGIAFTDPDAAQIGGAPLGVRLHPVQLYESIFCLVLFAFLVRLAKHKKFDGQVILAYTVLYAAGRFALEFFRGDADRGFIFGGLLSTSQFIAVILVPIAVGLWMMRRSKRPDLPAQAGTRRRSRRAGL